MRSGVIYRYPLAGTESSPWEKLTLFLLKTLAVLSAVYLDCVLLLLAVREFSILSLVFPSTWASAISSVLPLG
jgi:hypothetical protein